MLGRVQHNYARVTQTLPFVRGGVQILPIFLKGGVAKVCQILIMIKTEIAQIKLYNTYRGVHKKNDKVEGGFPDSA